MTPMALRLRPHRSIRFQAIVISARRRSVRVSGNTVVFEFLRIRRIMTRLGVSATFHSDGVYPIFTRAPAANAKAPKSLTPCLKVLAELRPFKIANNGAAASMRKKWREA